MPVENVAAGVTIGLIVVAVAVGRVVGLISKDIEFVYYDGAWRPPRVIQRLGKALIITRCGVNFLAPASGTRRFL